MYQLYFKREGMEMKIEPLTCMANNVTYIPQRFNDCIYVCNDRKVLRELAKYIKQKWIEGIERDLEKAKNIKIKNKY